MCGEELTTIGENPKAKSCRIASFARLSNRGESRETPGPISTFHSATRSQIKNYLEKSSASSSSSICHFQIYISTKCIYFLFLPFRRATTAHTPALNLNRNGRPNRNLKVEERNKKGRVNIPKLIRLPTGRFRKKEEEKKNPPTD